MAWKLMINAVDKTNNYDALMGAMIELHLNDRGRASFTTNPNAAVPTRLHSVLAYAQNGTTKLFAGLILQRTVNGGAVAQSKNEVTRIECTDGMTYLDWAFINVNYGTSGTVTLKQILTDIVAQLPGSFGITLDATQVTGPSIPVFAVVNKKASDMIRDLTTATGYVGRIDGDLKLKMFIPGTDAAPFSISDATPHCVSFDWQDPDFVPANKVILSCGPPTDAWAFVDTITFTADGIATSWTFDVADGVPYTDAGGGGTLSVNGVIRNISLGEYTWTLDTANAKATLAVGTAPTPGAGQIVTFKRNIQPPFTIISASGATPVIAEYDTAPDVLSVSLAKTTADGRLAQLNQQPRKATVVSFDIGWLPGQSVSVTLTPRSVSGATFVITDIQINLISDGLWQYVMSMTETSTFQGSLMDQWRSILGGGSSSGSVITVPASTGQKPVYFLGGNPTTWVQSPTPTWVPADGSPSGDSGTEYTIDSSIRDSLAATVTVRLRARSGSVTARLVELGSNTQVGISTAYTGTTFATRTFSVVLVPGVKRYQLQLLPSIANVDVNGIGYLE